MDLSRKTRGSAAYRDSTHTGAAVVGVRDSDSDDE
jgi:hypothetical protein